MFSSGSCFWFNSLLVKLVSYLKADSLKPLLMIGENLEVYLLMGEDSDS